MPDEHRKPQPRLDHTDRAWLHASASRSPRGILDKIYSLGPLSMRQPAISRLRRVVRQTTQAPRMRAYRRWKIDGLRRISPRSVGTCGTDRHPRVHPSFRRRQRSGTRFGRNSAGDFGRPAMIDMQPAVHTSTTAREACHRDEPSAPSAVAIFRRRVSQSNVLR
jgi:hypothetical protein